MKRIIGWLHMEPLLAVMLWGGIYPGVKPGLRDIPVLSFTYLRILLAMVVLFLASGSGQALILRRPLWKPLLSAGLAQAVFQLFLIAGLQRTSAGNSAILLATAPLLTAGWLALTGREPLGKRKGVTGRWGLKEAWIERAGRGTRTGYEVWYSRGELARNRKALHPQLGCAVYIRRLYTDGMTADRGRSAGCPGKD